MRLPKLLHLPVSQVVLLCFLIVLIAIGAVPSYLSGNWAWVNPPQVTNFKQLKSLRQNGLALPGWQTKQQQVETIGGHKWSIQELQRDENSQVTLLLLPQISQKDQPEVEWMDVNGFMTREFQYRKLSQTDKNSNRRFQFSWDTDSYRQLPFTVKSTSTSSADAKVEARFFRGWTRQQTFAVLQWYAWPGGGKPAPSSWFWADQMAQLQRRRLPWTAVTILIPMEPLADLETAKPLAESLGQTVQGALMADVLHPANR
ncbi:cyanoexosortase B system-associated protein [Cyanobacteria bacterium FACHB-472]|nr:cyanoexosortase B system-associated protein [Cyanobacteria bacterium FACHB-472]